MAQWRESWKVVSICEDGLGDVEGLDDGHVFPVKESSKLKFPPYWIRVEPTNNL